MDERPEILSSGSPEPPRWQLRWRGSAGRPGRPGRPGRTGRTGRAGAGPAAVAVAGVLLACLGTIACLTLLVAQRDRTVAELRTALRAARQPVTTAAPALPMYASSAMLVFPDKSGGSFLMVAAAIRPQPGSGPVTWLFVYGQHAKPGEHYGLLGGSCEAGSTVSYDWAEGTADWKGDLTIAAPDLFINPQDPDIWLLVHRMGGGGSLGGVRGPLIGGGAKTFRSAPPC
jgi:hypothetical protein